MKSTTSLKAKQKAQMQHHAEQFPLFKKGVTGSTIFAVKKKNVGGRPRTGKKQLAVWLSIENIEILKRIEIARGIKPGIMVEMLMSMCEPVLGWKSVSDENAPLAMAKLSGK